MPLRPQPHSAPRLRPTLALVTMLSLAATVSSAAFNAELRIDVDKPTVELSLHLYGLFFEDINYGSTAVPTRSSSRTAPSNTTRAATLSTPPLYAWQKVERDDARASLAVSETQPLNPNNRHYLEIAIAEPGRAGVSNSGFDGIRLDADARYDGALHARVADWSGPASVTITLEQPDGTSAGSLTFDGIDGFLRFPGGCIAHGHGLANLYHWKDTVGDVAERKPNWNL